MSTSISICKKKKKKEEQKILIAISEQLMMKFFVHSTALKVKKNLRVLSALYSQWS
jgi:hypothetical protein